MIVRNNIHFQKKLLEGVKRRDLKGCPRTVHTPKTIIAVTANIALSLPLHIMQSTNLIILT